MRQASSSLAHSSGEFGTKLYKKLVADNKDNVVFSPITVYTALCMTLLAAKGDTKLQLQVQATPHVLVCAWSHTCHEEMAEDGERQKGGEERGGGENKMLMSNRCPCLYTPL